MLSWLLFQEVWKILFWFFHFLEMVFYASGICLQLFSKCWDIPVLGVCLGHQVFPSPFCNIVLLFFISNLSTFWLRKPSMYHAFFHSRILCKLFQISTYTVDKMHKFQWSALHIYLGIVVTWQQLYPSNYLSPYTQNSR